MAYLLEITELLETPEQVERDINVLKNSSFSECENYLKTHVLTRDGLAFLIASRNVYLILLSAAHSSFDSFNELALVHLEIEELTLQYLDLHKILWVDAEEALIKTKFVAGIRKLFSSFPLSWRGEVALLRMGNKTLITEYEEKWRLRSKEAKNLRLRMSL